MFNVSRMPSKITWGTKNEKNFNLLEKRKSKDTNTMVTQRLELFDKDFKTAII